jgi:hypothetical protein
VESWNTYRIGVENLLKSSYTENLEVGRAEMRKRFEMYGS